eukprot:Lithocolla_globosa_v1_NODE_472_length_3961_cov_18.488735.p2 type:complete len:156 gc:universal NODE_472_length_3961_cov_18.488735:1813-2280(+)
MVLLSPSLPVLLPFNPKKCLPLHCLPPSLSPWVAELRTIQDKKKRVWYYQEVLTNYYLPTPGQLTLHCLFFKPTFMDGLLPTLKFNSLLSMWPSQPKMETSFPFKPTRPPLKSKPLHVQLREKPSLPKMTHMVVRSQYQRKWKPSSVFFLTLIFW